MAVSPKTTVRRQQWKREILELIRTTPEASRALIKRMCNLSMDSTLSLVGELLDEGLIETTGKAESHGAGRKATLLRIHEDGCYFIGVRFSADLAVAVCMDFSLRVVHSAQVIFSPMPDKAEVLRGVERCIDAVVEWMGDRRERLRGIGVGGPGVIDREHGAIGRYVYVSDFENVPICSWMEKKYGVPIYLEHGVKCTACAALTLPECDGIHDLLFCQIGRGASICVMKDGQVHSGAHYLSGEVGQMRMESGEVLERIVSSDALLRQWGKPGDLENLLACAENGEERAQELLRYAGHACAHALANAVMVMDPQAMVVSSALCISPIFRQAVEQGVRERSIPEIAATAQIVFLHADPVFNGFGAAMLPYRHDFVSG